MPIFLSCLTAALVLYSAISTCLWLSTRALLRAARRQMAALRRDPVTGVCTRGAWLDIAHGMVGRCRNPVLILCDLNNFKTVNDQFNHADGDQVLRLFADVLRREFGPTSHVGRFGGDEFVVLVDVPPTEMWREQLLEATKRCVVAWRGLDIGASFGLLRACQLPGYVPIDVTGRSHANAHASRVQLSRLLHGADLACMHAKQAQRAVPLLSAARWFDPAVHDVPNSLDVAPLIRNRHG